MDNKSKPNSYVDIFDQTPLQAAKFFNKACNLYPEMLPVPWLNVKTMVQLSFLRISNSINEYHLF
ncbi:MAG TPA: hypothetical protein DEB45_15835 [Alteromonas australica]|uniref:Uncharacterized protein n=1 Tax=Alteromonas australica TaxID=589873 RepID=A0A358E3J0_9ALTE|nr:hypothetical protein [Gammaproteobacteria bacterium]HBU52722.1 hypothetical protein [Alteromonas australica]